MEENIAIVPAEGEQSSNRTQSDVRSDLAKATTVEQWALAYLRTTSLADKLRPPPCPRAFCTADAPAPAFDRRALPGRPVELALATKARKAHTRGALTHPIRRADLFHRFLHHELQAAELMAWALLAFPETPEAFKRGLLKVLFDEVRHMHMYEQYLHSLGSYVGAFPVRDWFWTRVPTVQNARDFCATMGMGFEAANLDHTIRFADQLRAAGDEIGAEIQMRVHEEEIPHVSFALAWYRRLAGEDVRAPFDDFHGWREHLPAPLSPMVMKGEPLASEARLRAGFGPNFLEEIARWSLSGT